MLAAAALALCAAAAPPQDKWTQADLERESRAIEPEVARLRGESFARPVAVRIATRDDLLAYIRQRMAKTETPEKIAADSDVAKLLAVVPADLDLVAAAERMYEAQVAGFYDPDDDSFSLMDSMPRGVARAIMAHEFVHALDDQLFDIDLKLEAVGLDTDAQLALYAVVEGSATAAGNRWLFDNMSKLSPDDLAEVQALQERGLGDAPTWMWKPMLGAYLQGCAFLQRTDAWLTAQLGSVAKDDVRRAFEAPPRSTEQVLHPAKYWDDAQRDEPRKVRFDAAELAEGWSIAREDTLGEFMIAVLVTPPGERAALDTTNQAALLGLAFTNTVASGWGGDRLAVLRKDGARVLRWVTVWDSERDAAEFYGAMTQQLPSFEAAAKSLAGDAKKDSGAKLEYEPSEARVVVTVHSGLERGDLKKLLRTIEHAVE